jgi:hypothetical protein
LQVVISFFFGVFYFQIGSIASFIFVCLSSGQTPYLNGAQKEASVVFKKVNLSTLGNFCFQFYQINSLAFTVLIFTTLIDFLVVKKEHHVES